MDLMHASVQQGMMTPIRPPAAVPLEWAGHEVENERRHANKRPLLAATSATSSYNRVKGRSHIYSATATSPEAV